MLVLDLQFERGAFVLHAQARIDETVAGVCGPSGSGKSSLLALIAGLLRPTRGSIQLDGQVLADVAQRRFVPAWQRHIGLVFQDGQLFPHLSVRTNLLFGYRALTASQRRFEPAPIIDLLEIGPLLDRRPAQLSGGERSRVALGRALLYSPRLLLLDEPLSALDERLKQQILPFLRRVKQDLQVPMIYVSHAPQEVDYLADRVRRLEHGRLI